MHPAQKVVSRLLLAIVTTFVPLVPLASALPPLGITPISTTVSRFDDSWTRVEVIDDVAYIGTFGGVWQVPSDGQKSFVPVSHPTLGEPYRVTRPVKGSDGRIYAGASFGPVSESTLETTGAALYSLGSTADPITTWDGPHMLIGLDSQLRSLGNVNHSCCGCCEPVASEYLSDGTVQSLDGADGGPLLPADGMFAVSLSGYAVGDVHIPGTLGRGAALWAPDGSFSFIDETITFGNTVRDRADGQGLNVGLRFGGGGGYLMYGNQEPIPVGSGVIVSQTDFAVVSTVAGYYPGIVPDEPIKPVLLREIFPELETFGSSLHVTDVTAIDGHLFMSLIADDQLYLFGARDPSVIPEPSAILVALLGGLSICCIAARRATQRR